jgi:hypothetical protein
MMTQETLSDSGKGKITVRSDIRPECFLSQTVEHHEDRVATARSHLVSRPEERAVVEQMRDKVIKNVKALQEFCSVRGVHQHGRDLLNRAAHYQWQKAIKNRPDIDRDLVLNLVEMLLVEGDLGRLDGFRGKPAAAVMAAPATVPTAAASVPLSSQRPLKVLRYTLPAGFERPPGAFWCIFCVRRAISERRMTAQDPPTADSWHHSKECPRRTAKKSDP